MDRVKGKTALVTGAAQGLGAAIATLLVMEGAKVLLTDIDGEAVERRVEELKAIVADSAFAAQHDVAQESDWRTVAALADRELGGIDVLVNNAGIGSIASIEDEDLSTWRRVHAVDLDSVFIGCKLAMPLLERSGRGSIVNISSISGIIAGHNLAAYNSAKAAVRHLSKSIALHCARKGNGVRCNSVHPSFIDTPILDGMAANMDRDAIVSRLAKQVPLGRIGQPDDVAYAVLYLASDESSFVTGSELKVDGGISAM